MQYLLLNSVEQKNILSLIDKTKISEQKTCLIIGNKTKNEIMVLYVLVSKSLQDEMSVDKITHFLSEKLDMNIKPSNRKDLAQIGGISASKFSSIIGWIEELLQR